MNCTIWHNPRCSKSRKALELLRENGVEPEIRLYLKDPPSEDDLRTVLGYLAEPAQGLVRKGEARFRELGLSADSDEETLLRAMAENPILIERPVVICGTRAVIARPPERVLELL